MCKRNRSNKYVDGSRLIKTNLTQILIITKINKHLCCSGIWSRGCKTYITTCVRFFNGIVDLGVQKGVHQEENQNKKKKTRKVHRCKKLTCHPKTHQYFHGANESQHQTTHSRNETAENNNDIPFVFHARLLLFQAYHVCQIVP